MNRTLDQCLRGQTTSAFSPPSEMPDRYVVSPGFVAFRILLGWTGRSGGACRSRKALRSRYPLRPGGTGRAGRTLLVPGHERFTAATLSVLGVDDPDVTVLVDAGGDHAVAAPSAAQAAAPAPAIASAPAANPSVRRPRFDCGMSFKRTFPMSNLPGGDSTQRPVRFRCRARQGVRNFAQGVVAPFRPPASRELRLARGQHRRRPRRPGAQLRLGEGERRLQRFGRQVAGGFAEPGR